ncbi:MAG: putative lipid II flippase FtsW, partial [Verrucomicrobia bacterium]|nr:putative lipid II flippase FtsW [Verrucomicrobiota bacterium]
MKVAVTTLACCVAALLAMGMVMLYSSSMSQVGANYLKPQLVWCALGLIAGGVMATLNYRWLEKLALPIFGLAVVLLALVLVFGVRVNGARRWLEFGIRFQPSELAKLALIVALAWYGARFRRHMGSFWRGMVVPATMAGVVLGLIVLEPDVGTTLLLGAVCCIILLIAGIQLKYFLPPVLIALLGISLFVWKNPTRSDRIYSWLHLEETKMDTGRQVYQARLAFGSGGWSGVGLGDGRQKLGFIPFHYTDFILPVIGEELGIIATLGIVAAFAVIVLCGIYIAWNARDGFGSLCATGIASLIGLQAFINIAVVTGVLPNKGLPLPFISLGGSNLTMMLVCVGLLVSVARGAHLSETQSREAVGPDEISPANS